MAQQQNKSGLDRLIVGVSRPHTQLHPNTHNPARGTSTKRVIRSSTDIICLKFKGSCGCYSTRSSINVLASLTPQMFEHCSCISRYYWRLLTKRDITESIKLRRQTKCRTFVKLITRTVLLLCHLPDLTAWPTEWWCNISEHSGSLGRSFHFS